MVDAGVRTVEYSYGSLLNFKASLKKRRREATSLMRGLLSVQACILLCRLQNGLSRDLVDDGLLDGITRLARCE